MWVVETHIACRMWNRFGHFAETSTWHNTSSIDVDVLRDTIVVAEVDSQRTIFSKSGYGNVESTWGLRCCCCCVF